MKIQDVEKLMMNTKAVYLASINSEGAPEIRALLNLSNKKAYPKLQDKAYTVDGETVTIYFTTNTSSRKVAQMRANSTVSLYYCDAEHFNGVCLTGRVEEITDMEVKKSFWQTGWLMYYHKGPSDPDYALLKFTSKSIHCWAGLGIHNFGNSPAKENVEVF